MALAAKEERSSNLRGGTKSGVVSGRENKSSKSTSKSAMAKEGSDFVRANATGLCGERKRTCSSVRNQLVAAILGMFGRHQSEF